MHEPAITESRRNVSSITSHDGTQISFVFLDQREIRAHKSECYAHKARLCANEEENKAERHLHPAMMNQRTHQSFVYRPCIAAWQGCVSGSDERTEGRFLEISRKYDLLDSKATSLSNPEVDP